MRDDNTVSMKILKGRQELTTLMQGYIYCPYIPIAFGATVNPLEPEAFISSTPQ